MLPPMPQVDGGRTSTGDVRAILRRRTCRRSISSLANDPLSGPRNRKRGRHHDVVGGGHKPSFLYGIQSVIVSWLGHTICHRLFLNAW